MPKPTFFRLAPDKRQHIIDAAINEFAEHAYQETSVNYLIARMGIATGSFYQYFTDKKDCYFYVLLIYREKMLDTVTKYDITLNLTNITDSLNGGSTHPQLVLDDLGDKISNEQFNKSPPSIIRDWVFEILIGGGRLDIYNYDIFDGPNVPQHYKDNKEVIMAMFIGIRAVVEQFATYSHDFERYAQLFDMMITILNDGITNPRK